MVIGVWISLNKKLMILVFSAENSDWHAGWVRLFTAAATQYQTTKQIKYHSNHHFPPSSVMDTRPPIPPFTEETALLKVQLAEDAWNTRDPERVSLAYTEDSEWRNRIEFVNGRPAIIELLRRKWARELDYRLRKELWGFRGNRIAVRFEYEFHDAAGQWFRAYGNENWEFAANGLMQRRFASINDLPITEAGRKFRWERRGPIV